MAVRPVLMTVHHFLIIDDQIWQDDHQSLIIFSAFSEGGLFGLWSHLPET